MPAQTLYRIAFHQNGQVYEVYARGVSHAAMAGFVEVEDLVFGSRSQLVLDPSEEKLKTEFEAVTRFYVPIHAVMRIDEVTRQGPARILGESAKITPFPGLPGAEPRR